MLCFVIINGVPFNPFMRLELKLTGHVPFENFASRENVVKIAVQTGSHDIPSGQNMGRWGEVWGVEVGVGGRRGLEIKRQCAHKRCTDRQTLADRQAGGQWVWKQSTDRARRVEI